MAAMSAAGFLYVVEWNMSRVLSILVVLCTALLSRAALAGFPELANLVPADTNALVMIDMDKLLASPAAEKGDWKNKIENAFEEGMTILPPKTRRAILASQIDLEFMTQLWQTELLEVTEPTELTAVAQKTGGTIDRIGELAAVRMPHDAYVVRFSRDDFGVMLPANRQSVVRWIREVHDRTKPAFSPYLAEAYDYANDLGTPVIMAIDLENAVAESEIRSRLQENWKDAGLEGKADPLAVIKVLASIRGATLGITLKDRPFGKIKIDFGVDAKPLAAIAKPLFLHILERRGLTIEEFEDWKYEVNGKTVSLEGHFTSSGLRRIFSTFDRPAGFQTIPEKPPESKLTKEEQTAQSTLAYYKSVQKLLKDLKGRKTGSGGTYTTGSIAQWCTNYSRKINNLPLLNVDPEMIQYGTNVAETLTQVAQALNGGNIQGGIDARSSSPVYNTYSNTNIYGYGYRGGWFGGGTVPLGYTNNVAVVDPLATTAQRANLRANARAQSSKSAREIFARIDQGTADIRAKMVQKYQLEF
jgi:hypothetical protein